MDLHVAKMYWHSLRSWGHEVRIMRDGFENLRCRLAALQQEKVTQWPQGANHKKTGMVFGVFKIRWLGSSGSGIDNFDVYFRLQPFGDENAFRFSVEAMEHVWRWLLGLVTWRWLRANMTDEIRWQKCYFSAIRSTWARPARPQECIGQRFGVNLADAERPIRWRRYFIIASKNLRASPSLHIVRFWKYGRIQVRIRPCIIWLVWLSGRVLQDQKCNCMRICQDTAGGRRIFLTIEE